jgi:methionyl-tRNA formyltransferase
VQLEKVFPLKFVYAGTPEFAARCLEILLGSRHQVVAVLTQPDRPAGRGLALAASPVKVVALAHGIPVEQPTSLKDPKVQAWLGQCKPDVLIVAAYGLLLPQAILDISPYGAINVHPSLLPRWRGAAPIQRALLAGDVQTGISIMQMDAGLDTGPVLLQEAAPIFEEDTAGTLHDRLAELGGALLVKTLDVLEAGRLVATLQSARDATYAPKIEKREARLDWQESAVAVSRRIRTFNPVPGAGACLRDVELKIWRGTAVAANGTPGEVLNAGPDGLLVACGKGAVLLTELQRQGGKRLAAADFLRGFPLAAGDRFLA